MLVQSYVNQLKYAILNNRKQYVFFKFSKLTVRSQKGRNILLIEFYSFQNSGFLKYVQCCIWSFILKLMPCLKPNFESQASRWIDGWNKSYIWLNHASLLRLPSVRNLSQHLGKLITRNKDDVWHLHDDQQTFREMILHNLCPLITLIITSSHSFSDAEWFIVHKVQFSIVQYSTVT